MAAEPKAPVRDVSLLYNTRKWKSRLQKSFGSRAAAREQCGRDWPRMTVEDHRTYGKQMADYLWGNEELDYFGNQSSMARPFIALMRGFPDHVVTQCSDCAFKLVIHNGGVTLHKRFLLWQQRHGRICPKPVKYVDATVHVGLQTTRVDFRVRRVS
jgi:hypothetical protein